MQSYDAVVIGAGHNGLACACYLARAGMTVLVVERNATIGGMTSTKELALAGYHTDVHASGYQLAALSSAADELRLAVYGLELIRPAVSLAKVFADERCLAIMARIEDTCANLAQFSKRDADTWRALFTGYLAQRDELRRELESPPASPATIEARLKREPGGVARIRFRAQSVRSWTTETFESEEMRGLMADFAAHAGFAPDDAGGAAFAFVFLSVIQDAGNRAVKGGMGRLPAALAACFTEAGGAIRTGAAVAAIRVDDGRANGVRLADGSEIATECVVSSAHPRHLVLDLLAEAALDPRITAEMERYDLGASQMGIHLALSAPATYAAGATAAQATQVHVMPTTTAGLADALCAVRAGRLPAEPPAFIVNEAAVDPGRVPEGRSSLKIILTAVPYDIDWGEARTRYASAVIERIATAHIPDLEQKIVGTAILSPVDYEADVVSALHGTVTHGAMVPYQQGAMRPTLGLGQYRGPIRGLYLCGADSHPGPGVSMMPGRNAAQVIVGDLGRG
ncbi:MAG: NAD(P)/FAD-dependent oxidoreductase [Gammaproteobacteria bacterium]|nr:NAD(P)/FAD-dependent oxidoreductase [Gammaproteobacteria bacterium]